MPLHARICENCAAYRRSFTFVYEGEAGQVPHYCTLNDVLLTEIERLTRAVRCPVFMLKPALAPVTDRPCSQCRSYLGGPRHCVLQPAEFQAPATFSCPLWSARA